MKKDSVSVYVRCDDPSPCTKLYVLTSPPLCVRTMWMIPLTRGWKNKGILIGIVYWASSSHLSSFATKIKAQNNSEDLSESESEMA